MTLPLDVLETEVLNLPAMARSHLLDRLLASLEADPAIATAWADEAQRRDQEIESGKTVSLSGKDVLASLRAQLT